ncbi:phosphotransferase [Thalassomonas viridans]|uniref:Phosphotransferase n=1 Tax=Thalassomonas viridans TaxID=137584 RepID=A0AAE9ZBX0_9GAMM|nr:phosphotransferase [Thalassomonas viridans]WDE09230.1 phosphotransferase [Thalassomonas viridans]
MNNPRTVCILTAGIGSRMGESLANSFNKAILPINDQAIISQIIANFPADSHFVIATGYLAEQVRDFLTIAHPDLHFSFVDVPEYTGKHTGPGLSLSYCRELLQTPFYFVSCDTLWQADPALLAQEENWVGVAALPAEQQESYCNFSLLEGNVKAIYDKVAYRGQEPVKSFTGLMYIRDYQSFWHNFQPHRLIKEEVQVSNGLSGMLSAGLKIKALDIRWTDVGTLSRYKEQVLKYSNYDFSKTDESLYIQNGLVTKYFVDEAITANRVAKARLKPDIFPEITEQKGGFYSYRYLAGDTFYNRGSLNSFGKLLEWLEQQVWPTTADNRNIKALCKKFYYDKTMQRLEMFFKKHGESYRNEAFCVNGRPLNPIREILARLNWDELIDGEAAFIHGDLQFDNIIIKDDGRFCLLDWRQDFAGEIKVGDLYYDFAKLYGGIILNYSYIKKNLLSYQEQDNNIEFNFAQDYLSSSYIRTLEAFIESKGYSVSKVKQLVALVFLNMAPLHHYPFDKALFFLGLSRLTATLD